MSRTIRLTCALAIMALGLAGMSYAQTLPPPFGAPGPQMPNPGDPKSMRACTKDYAKELDQQLAQLEQLRGAQADQILAICDGIASTEKALEALATVLGKDKDTFTKELENQVRELGKPFGIPNIDFRFVKHACLQGAGEIERFIVTEIGRLRSEIQRCGSI